MQPSPRRLAPFFDFPPALEHTINVLDGLPSYRRRQWLKDTQTQFPRFVYRYVGDKILDDHLSDYLVGSYFYLSSVSDFNDPFDMGAYVTINANPRKRSEKINRILKARNPDLTWKQRRKETGKLMAAPDQLSNIRLAYEKSIKDMGAICFTPHPASLLMWSHYGDHHRGIALQFHLANDIRTMGRLIKVKYSDTYPAIDWGENTEKALESVLATKNIEWEYEKEYRIFVVDAANSYLSFQPKALTGIIFGCRANQEIKERVFNMLEKRSAMKHNPVTIYKAVKHSREYRVTIQKDLSLKWPS